MQSLYLLSSPSPTSSTDTANHTRDTHPLTHLTQNCLRRTNIQVVDGKLDMRHVDQERSILKLNAVQQKFHPSIKHIEMVTKHQQLYFFN